MSGKTYKTYELEIWQGNYSIEFIQSLGIGPLFSGLTITVANDNETIVNSNWDQDAYFDVDPPSQFYNDSSGYFRENLIKKNYDYPYLKFTNKISNGNTFIGDGLVLNVRKFYYPDENINYYPHVELQIANNQKQLSYDYINNQPDGGYIISHEPQIVKLNDDGVYGQGAFGYLKLIGETNSKGKMNASIYCFEKDGWTSIDIPTTVLLKEVRANTPPSLLNRTRMTNYIIPTIMVCGAGFLVYYLIDKNNQNDNKKRVKQIKY